MSNQLLINGQLETFSKSIASWQSIPGTWIVAARLMFSYNINLKLTSCKREINSPDLLILNDALFQASGITNTTGQKSIPQGYRMTFTSPARTLNAGATFSISTFHKHYCNWGAASFGAFGQGVLESSVCILRITFVDGTTQDLNYSTCPTVEWGCFDCPELLELINYQIERLNNVL